MPVCIAPVRSVILTATAVLCLQPIVLAQKNTAQEPSAIQEVIENARSRCRGMRGAFAMKASAVRNDIDLNGDGALDYLIDGNAFECDRGNARSYSTNQTGRSSLGLRNQRITIIMSEKSDYTIHEFPTARYDIIDFNDEKILMIHETEDNCISRKKVRQITTYQQGQLIGPGCYRALVWRDGIFSAAR
jgi:low affinity Fe/Cu permease